MRKQRRLIRILLGLDALLLVGIVCAWSVAVNLRAAEPKSAPAAAPASQPAPTPANQPAATPANAPAATPASAPAAPSASARPIPASGGHHSASEPTAPEPTATIRDDPTIAPDPQESADNNVSFPNDI